MSYVLADLGRGERHRGFYDETATELALGHADQLLPGVS